MLDACRFIENHPEFNHIIFTGGEPLIHQTDIQSILRKTISGGTIHRGTRVTIETNGTILPTTYIEKIMNYIGLWVVSPKLYLDNWDEHLMFFNSQRNIQFKFVITDIDDDIHKIQRRIRDRDITHPVIVQPNNDGGEYMSKCFQLAEYIITNAPEIRMLPQLQKIFWNNKRGI